MPKMFFNKDIKNFRISSINQKNIILKKLGVNFVITKKLIKNFLRLNLNFLLKKFYPKN